jgi:hypothetical protein
MSSRAFGKLLHLARFNGWCPEKDAPESPSNSWDTEMILPHLGPYLSGIVSKTDAHALMRALTRANATGEVAMDRTLLFPVMGLLEISREGPFEVRFQTSEPAYAPPEREVALA